MTTTINQIEEKTGGNITPEYFYEWGDEQQGFVSCGLYMDNIWYPCGQIPKQDAINRGLKYHCPFN